MYKNIAFIGGIHGVGKSRISHSICNELNIEYLSASELLKWTEINIDSKNKKVNDISNTQDLLMFGLINRIQKDRYYLLDGHYCLINKHNEVEAIPLRTFKQINPIVLNLILGDISDIKTQIEKRDNKFYDHTFLEDFQNRELEHAQYLSKTLGITLNIGKKNEYKELVNSMNQIIPK